MDDTGKTLQKSRFFSKIIAAKLLTAGRASTHWVSQLFLVLRWLTEHAVSLLRLAGTLALLIAVIYVLYNVYQSRHTVVVKPFEVPVSMKNHNHAQAGRIIANTLKFHLLETQSRFQDELSRHGDQSDNLPYSPPSRRNIVDNNTLLGTGGDIKLPETGISIDNMIEFISGMFGRKNLTGAVYIDQDKLYLQMVLDGRILTISEDDLPEQQRTALPPTDGAHLNLQRLSAMLELASPHILGIASEEHNLYYYCTQRTETIEYQQGEYQQLFRFCHTLKNQTATPDTFFQLLYELNKAKAYHYTADSVAYSVLTFIKGEAEKKRWQFCQSKQASTLPACATIPPLAKVMLEQPKPITRTLHNSVVLTYTPNAAIAADSPDSVDAETGNAVRSPPFTPIAELQAACFTDGHSHNNSHNKAAPVKQSSRISTINARNNLQSNQIEAEATQLLHNQLYTAALRRYQQAIRTDCHNALAWANMGILFRTAPLESGLYRIDQAQAALIQAIQLDDKSAGWMRHSLCVAQAYEHTNQLEQYLNNDSCQQARQLEPINKVLYDKLFYIAIADRYFQTNQYKAARVAYQQALSVDKVRNCRMQTVLKKLAVLQKKTGGDALQTACQLFRESSAPQAAETACEDDLQRFAQEHCD